MDATVPGVDASLNPDSGQPNGSSDAGSAMDAGPVVDAGIGSQDGGALDVDSGVDAGMDSGMDASMPDPPEAGMPPMDAGADAGGVGSTDAGSASGADAGLDGGAPPDSGINAVSGDIWINVSGYRSVDPLVVTLSINAVPQNTVDVFANGAHQLISNEPGGRTWGITLQQPVFPEQLCIPDQGSGSTDETPIVIQIDCTSIKHKVYFTKVGTVSTNVAVSDGKWATVFPGTLLNQVTLPGDGWEDGQVYDFSLTTEPTGTDEKCWFHHARGWIQVGEETRSRLICSDQKITVDTLADTDDAAYNNGVCEDSSGNCSLRAAIITASRATEPVWIELGADTYAITKGSVDPSQVHEEHGDLDFRAMNSTPNEILIVGAGVGSTTIRNNQGDRSFDLHSNVHLVVEDLTLGPGGGNGISGGAARVRDMAHLELHNVNVVNNGNSGDAHGGAFIVQQGGSLLLSRVRMEDNYTGNRGGGIYARGQVEIFDAVFQGNTAANGAGLYIGDFSSGNQPGDVLMVNTTLTDNTASNYAGAILAHNGNLVLLHTTVTRNTGNGSEAIYIDANGVGRFYNSALGENFGATEPDCAIDPSGTLSTRGRNFLGSDQNCIAHFEAQDDLPEGGVNQDPQLAGLTSETDHRAGHDPEMSSPLVGMANEALCPVMDQRGLQRMTDNVCDVGAVERP
jgi:CSLREA domain-containing protein